MTFTSESLFKILGPGRMPLHGVGQWPKPGVWRRVRGPLVPCRNGLHLCRPLDILDWWAEGAELWHVATKGERLDDTNQVVARNVQLLERVTTWNSRAMRLFACDCAERAVSIYTTHDDPAPLVNAVAVARRYAHDMASADELDASGAGACTAAWDAVEAGAWDVVWDISGASAKAAAWDAALAAGHAAGPPEPEHVRGAARAAARTAIRAVARAAGAAERAWQTERIVAYLNGDAP